jgi:LSD1 subclass zinc finger protein
VLILEEVRCPRCDRMLTKLNGQAEIKCSRCKALIVVDTVSRKMYIKPEHQK